MFYENRLLKTYSQEQYSSDHLLHESVADPNHQSPSPPCANGHRSTISLRTDQGGSFCFLCFSNLISDQRVPTVHISYALHQLSIALSEPIFLRTLRTSHIHFLVSPLVHALSSIDDAPIAIQIMDTISVLCSAVESSIGEDFVERISDQLSSGALGWSRRQLHMLHCFGVLVSCENIDVNSHIRDKEALVCQLILSSLCPKLLCLSLEALAKTQRDDVRLNCVALLTILAQQGLLANSHTNNVSSMSLDGMDDDPMQTTETVVSRPSLNILFAEAIKGPLLSTDSEVQIRTLDLIFHYLSQESTPSRQIQVLVEENVADYIFEILRLSAEHSFWKRLVIGFPSVIQVLHYVGEVPCHPFQIQTLKLISSCISDFPGIASSSQVQEIALVLKRMLERYYSQEIGLFTDAFAIICSVFVSLLNIPSFAETPDVLTSLQESLRHAILASLSLPEKDSTQILHAVYLLNEVYAYCTAPTSMNKTSCIELRHSVIDVCASHLLPWFLADVNEVSEEATLGIMETFQSILLQNSDIQAKEFAEVLVSADWFSFSFGCLGNFPTAKIKQRVYLMLSSLVDVLLEQKAGSYIRDAIPCLPTDPQDLLFLLGKDSSNNQEFAFCQSAALLIFHTSWIYNDRSLQNERYQLSYCLEAERILFHLLNEYDWDLGSCNIHLESLKWLFQQEKGDNYAANLLVNLLTQLAEKGQQETNVISILNLMIKIISIFPTAFNHLIMNGHWQLRDTAITQDHEGMMVIGILSLVLYHLSDGELQQVFLQIVLSGAVDWQTFFGPSSKLDTLSVGCIRWHNFSRLMHFGTPQIKLMASCCLLELFTGLSQQIDIKKEQLRCSSSYLKSMKAVLGGLVFCDDIRVPTNYT
ncbi:hypothetical protein CARUB_v10007250mg, partial [Capsella rubella]